MGFTAKPIRTGTLALACTACLFIADKGIAASTDFPEVRKVSPNIISVQVSDQVAVGAKNFVASMGDRAIGFLADASLTTEQRKEEFRKLLEDSFDMETIGRFAAGKTWRQASPQQRKEYQKLFKQMIVDVYSRRFEEYEGQKFEVRAFRPEGKKDIQVTSFIVPQGEPDVQVDWRVRYKDGRYKIVDVVVEGVSMAITQRSDFSSIIQRGGGNFQILIDHMRKQVQSGSTSADL
jgi:phospholipid transport system substrate-binding protein